MLDNGARSVLDVTRGVFLGTSARPPRIGFLFPGQGAGRRGDGGALRRRFADVDELYRTLPMPSSADLVATENAQPRIVTSSVAGLRVLASLGIEAVTAAGHSLGELTALHWAGAMDEAGLLRAAAARGRIMAQASDGGGAMASVVAPPEAVVPLLIGEPVVIAGYNSPRQTVVSGPADAVKRVCERAASTRATRQPGFRSPTRSTHRPSPRRPPRSATICGASPSHRSPGPWSPRSPAPSCRPRPKYPPC